MSGTILNGVPAEDEAAHESYVAEKHIHVRERWFGAMAVPAGGHCAEQGMDPFVITSGADTWGAAVQMFDINDTPSIPGYKFYDFRKIFIVGVSKTATYRVRFLYGNTTDADALAALQYSDFVYRADGTVSDRKPIEVSMPRIPVGTKLWGMAWCDGETAATFSFMIGGHLYLK